MATLRFKDNPATIEAGKIICLGRNYVAHAKEMKAEIPAEPVLFLKPATAILSSGGTIIVPPFAHELHHEVELVALISTGGRNIPAERAMDHVSGYAVGLDMTLRDVQAKAKTKGLPWTVSKGFDTSAPLSLFVSRDSIPDPYNLTISLRVNDVLKQHSSTRNMMYHLDHIIAYSSTIFTLEPGDLIFTGTPEGVGPVLPNDVIVATIEGIGTLTAHVGPFIPWPAIENHTPML
jgi:acylpyruvate hydrolase